MRHLSLGEVLRIHAALLASSGGAQGIRDLGRVQAALAQPKATFEGTDLHPTLVEKAAALGFSLIQGHAFVDGNKRLGHAAMSVLLLLNGLELEAPVDEQERVVLGIASGQVAMNELVDWFNLQVRPKT